MGWVNYNGLMVPSASTGDAGQYLTSNFQALANAVNNTAGTVAVYGSSGALTSDSKLIWDPTNHWLGIGGTPYMPFEVWGSSTVTTGEGQGGQVNLSAAPPSSSTAVYFGFIGEVSFDSSVPYPTTSSTGNAGVCGLVNTSATGTVAKASGVMGQFTCTAAGVITDAAALRACAPYVAYGLSFSQYAGLNIEESSINGAYGIYQGGTTDKNYFAAKIGIGQTSPTASLHVQAGTATAGTSPVKLTAGTNLTTPEAGAVEYDGHKLYFTPVGARRAVNLADGVITSTTSVANTTTETTAYTDTLPASELTVGRVLRVTLLGRYSTANGTDTFTLRLKLGSTTLISIVSSASSVTNVPLKAVLTATVRSTGSSGTVFAFGEAMFNHTDKSVTNTATTTVNTTTAENITATVQWTAANASDSVSIDQAFAEFLN